MKSLVKAVMSTAALVIVLFTLSGCTLVTDKFPGEYAPAPGVPPTLVPQETPTVEGDEPVVELLDEPTVEPPLESRCGLTTESQHVERYDGTLGVTTGFVQAHQSPVGLIQWNDNLASIYATPGNVSGVEWCTGTLIDTDVFLTAGHCFDSNAPGWVLPQVNGSTTIEFSQNKDL